MMSRHTLESFKKAHFVLYNIPTVDEKAATYKTCQVQRRLACQPLQTQRPQVTAEDGLKLNSIVKSKL